MTLYALVIDEVVQSVGRLPTSARRLDTGDWVMGLATAPAELVAECGWLAVVDNPPAYDPTAEVLVPGDVAVVDSTPVRQYTVRAKTDEELAAEQQAVADETERQQARQAVVNLREYADLTSPTNAQTVAVVKLLCRVAVALIRNTFRGA